MGKLSKEDATRWVIYTCLCFLSFVFLKLQTSTSIHVRTCDGAVEIKDTTSKTAPDSAAVGPSEDDRDATVGKMGGSVEDWENTCVCCCGYAGGSSVGFMMAGCVFWEGTGVELGAFPWAACQTQANSVNILVIKTTLAQMCD